MIHPSSIVAESGGDILASALPLFHGLFSRLEENGVIVRDFPQASDNNNTNYCKLYVKIFPFRLFGVYNYVFRKGIR